MGLGVGVTAYSTEAQSLGVTGEPEIAMEAD